MYSLTEQHSHMPEHLSRPAGLHQSHGLLHLAPAQTAANTKLSITNRKSSNSWELSGLRRNLDSTWPWFLQCTPLGHQKDPILLTRCQHRHRSGWPPLSGQSNPSLLRDLEENNTIKSRFSTIGPNGSKNCQEWFQLYFHMSLVRRGTITNRSRPGILSTVRQPCWAVRVECVYVTLPLCCLATSFSIAG